jgi:hypothetical protein
VTLTRWLGLSLLLTALYGFVTYPQLFVTASVRRTLLGLNNGTTEQFACLYGVRIGNTAFVASTRPAPPARVRGNAWATEIVCRDAWFLLGMAHSHPMGINCWFRFPGTGIPTSDLVTFENSRNELSVIVCGETLVWVQA